jgi:pyrophosphatase PpaX
MPSPRDVEAILFDFDGTLADTIDLIVASFRFATRAVLGKPLPDEVVLKNLGRPLGEYLEKLAPPGRAEELIAVYRRHNMENHDRLIREYPHVRETVEELSRRGYRLGVVTSKGRELAAKGMAALGFGGLFAPVVALEDTTRHKPDPEPIGHALTKLHTTRRRAAYVGDSPWDIVAGRAAGVVTVAVTWGGFSRPDLEAADPDRIVTDPLELLEVFASPPLGRTEAGR